MLLQTRGRMTAQALAEALEVSTRTVYRDVEALGAAGIPVTSESGPGGGIGLIDSYRTTLTGLNEDEARALFMLSVPAPLAKLGVSERLRAALLKVSAALPADRQGSEMQTRQRIHLDSAWWFQSDEPAAQLPALYQAAWQDRKARIVRALHYGPLADARIEQMVDPYGLVAKANVWYLVCAAGGRVLAHRVSHIVEAQVLDEPFERPPISTWRVLGRLVRRVREEPAALPRVRARRAARAPGSVADAGRPDRDRGRGRGRRGVDDGDADLQDARGRPQPPAQPGRRRRGPVTRGAAPQHRRFRGPDRREICRFVGRVCACKDLDLRGPDPPRP